MSAEDLDEARKEARALQPPARYGGWLFVGALRENYRDEKWVPEVLKGAKHSDRVQMEAFFYIAVRHNGYRFPYFILTCSSYRILILRSLFPLSARSTGRRSVSRCR